MLTAGFDTALAGTPARLIRSDGTEIDLAVHRWRDQAAGEDTWMLDRCTGPAIDLGCGPGRLVEALTHRGIPALGVDISTVAQQACRHRHAPMIRTDLFAPLPHEGHWHHALLADGNIGIGGDPLRLLRRCRELLAHHGTAVVEVEPPNPGATGWRTYRARLERGGSQGPWFPWAVVGADAIGELAPAAGLHLVRLEPLITERRWFAHLTAAGARDAVA